MTIALLLFAVAAVGGLVIAVMRFKGKPYPPMGLALVHGAVAAAGLVALIALVARGQGTPRATTSLVLFLVAALGGFGLFFYHLRKVALPKWLVVVHALVAVVAFLILLAGSWPLT
jgi:hypothetical protein